MNSFRLSTTRRGVVAGFGIVAAALLYLWQHTTMVNLGYRVEQGRAELARLSHLKTEMELEVASLSQLSRIETLARARMGMDSPAPVQLVRVVDSATPTPLRDEATPREGHLLLAATRHR